MRPIFRQESINDQSVAYLDIAALPAAPRQCAGIAGFTPPVGNDALGILDVDVEIAMRIGPFDLRDRSDQANGLVAVKLSRERVMGVSLGAARYTADSAPATSRLPNPKDFIEHAPHTRVLGPLNW